MSISDNLNFALVTNDVQCITIQIIDDSILEEEETFFLETLNNNSLISAVPTVVLITIRDNDGMYDVSGQITIHFILFW